MQATIRSGLPWGYRGRLDSGRRGQRYNWRGNGADLLEGGAGNDLIFAGIDASADTVDGGAGNDEIYGGAGNDNLSGGAGADVIYNGSGNDTVNGDAGSDTIWGGGGDDNLTGGADSDQFAFIAGNGNDTVTDFNFTEDDILNLEAFGFTDAAAAIALMSDVGSNVELALGAGQLVTLLGVTVADFQADTDALLI